MTKNPPPVKIYLIWFSRMVLLINCYLELFNTGKAHEESAHSGDLKNFVLEEGHTIVPRFYKTKYGFALGNWVNDQRTNKKKIKPERKSKLDALGFVWKVM